MEEIDRKIKERSDEVSEEEEEEQKEPVDPLQKLSDRFVSYMSQAPVIGFNSAKYDLTSSNVT